MSFGERYENWLDAGYGSCTLSRRDCRAQVKTFLLRFHKTRVHIHHAVIMPTHVHALMEPLHEQRLSKIMQGIKGASSRNCNQILGTSGPFWMPETYDHIVRNEKEYQHYFRYINENPKKAGLKNGAYWLM
ncbi:transposase [Kiritimatiellota bacterium B12222]|nr:transposase [Kiritimatiellota bacterium B12222]